MKKTLSYIVVGIVVVLTYSSAFVVIQGTQALVTQFGKVVGTPVTEPGLHWKIPFIQKIRRYEARILEWDGSDNTITTKDKKFIQVDTTARWRISDAKVFAEKLFNNDTAVTRLTGILDGATRDVIAKHNLVETVRNSNGIIKRLEELKAQTAEQEKSGTIEIEDEYTGDIEKVTVGREKLSADILERAKAPLERLGIKLIDVQLKRISYVKSVEEKVYERMISERKRIAEKIRSVGKGEQAKIRGRLNRDLKQIESTAYRKSKEIRGKAEAQSTAIYAASLKQDPNFFEFVRTLEAYKKTIAKNGSFILSTDSEFLSLLKRKK